MTDNLHQLREKVLRLWTVARVRESAAEKEDFERWMSRERRLRGEVVFGVREELPMSAWEPFALALQDFEDAVRVDEQGKKGGQG